MLKTLLVLTSLLLALDAHAGSRFVPGNAAGLTGTPNTCVHFDAGGNPVSAAGDCPNGDTNSGASNVAFASSWDGDANSPSKNVVYDELHLLDTDDDGKVNSIDQVAGITNTDVNGVVQSPLLSSGTGAVAKINAPTFVNPALGTPSAANLTNATHVQIAAIDSLGTNNATALATASGSPNGFPLMIASGTSALGTAGITTGACATLVTTSATNVATTDVIAFTPNADIHAVPGYTPATTGGLEIFAYPTTNNVNFLVCNPTSGTLTPTAVTLNWRVTR